MTKSTFGRSFTGSARVGWDLKARANRKRVTLELGGNAAAIVHDDADVARALDVVGAGGGGGWLALVTGAADRDVLARLVGLRTFSPVTVFDLSGWPDAATVPGIVMVRGSTASAAVDRWNGLAA